jgi:hypothetical protein
VLDFHLPQAVLGSHVDSYHRAAVSTAFAAVRLRILDVSLKSPREAVRRFVQNTAMSCTKIYNAEWFHDDYFALSQDLKAACGQPDFAAQREDGCIGLYATFDAQLTRCCDHIRENLSRILRNHFELGLCVMRGLCPDHDVIIRELWRPTIDATSNQERQCAYDFVANRSFRAGNLPPGGDWLTELIWHLTNNECPTKETLASLATMDYCAVVEFVDRHVCEFLSDLDAPDRILPQYLGLSLSSDGTVHRQGKKPVELGVESTQWILLRELCTAGENRLTPQDLLSRWPKDRQKPAPKTIKEELSRLRTKILPLGISIENKRYSGYRLEPLTSAKARKLAASRTKSIKNPRRRKHPRSRGETGQLKPRSQTQ